MNVSLKLRKLTQLWNKKLKPLVIWDWGGEYSYGARLVSSHITCTWTTKWRIHLAHLDTYDSLPSQHNIGNRLTRMVMMYHKNIMQFFTKPPVDKLLPDIPPLPPGYEIPKTLVLNLTGTLVHTDFVFGKGYLDINYQGLKSWKDRVSPNSYVNYHRSMRLLS